MCAGCVQAFCLLQVLGVSVVGGVVVMILLAPANALIATVAKKLQVRYILVIM